MDLIGSAKLDTRLTLVGPNNVKMH